MIEVLCRHLKHSNRNFIEIGTSDGLESNATYLINAFEFDAKFVEGIRGADFRENYAQIRQHKIPWQGQFAPYRTASCLTSPETDTMSAL